MTESFRALCSDFYVNQKLSVKLDLPRGREAMLDLFERVRRTYPSMGSFRRYKDELALESKQTEAPHRWLAIRPSNVRSGVVNPSAGEDAYGLHRHVLELAPFFLSISPLDVEYLELLYGFDFAARGNQDLLVAHALLEGTPLEKLFEDGSTGPNNLVPLDFQPMLGFVLPDSEPEPPAPGAEGETQVVSGTEVHMEVKTRTGSGSGSDTEARAGTEPISIYLTLRRYEPVDDLKELPAALDRLAAAGQQLIENRVIPYLVRPIREAIGSSDFE
ncbi:MAG: hypothetical protein AAGI17_10555 [Planctomycetota bacterium]